MVMHLVSVVLDESGSMMGSTSGVFEGVNGFFDVLREQPANMRVSLLKFNDTLAYVYRDAYLAAVEDLTPDTYHPHHGTRLHDAVLKAIADLEPVVAQREGKATVVIVTDGHDTDSVSLVEDVKAQVEAKRQQGWKFLFFGPNEWIGEEMGVDPGDLYQLGTGPEAIRGAFEVAAEQAVKLLTAGSGPIAL